VLDTIFGLPVHALIVHATVVIVPTAALVVALAAGWPRFRRWAGFLPLLLSAISVLLVPLSTASGEALEQRVGHSDRIEQHAQLAEGLLLPVLILAVAAAALCWLHLKEVAVTEPTGWASRVIERTGGPGRPGTATLTVLSLVAAIGVIGTVVQVARIGHSGAEAAWSDVVSGPAPVQQSAKTG
jgi:hypothetical protein